MKKKVTENHPLVAKKIRASLKLSRREGALASVSSNMGLSYISPFALAMNATTSQIGILHAITSLLPSIVQLYSAKLIEKFSRKKIVLQSTLIQFLLWIPIIITGVLFVMGVPYMVWALIALVSLFYAFGGIGFPVWFSWMGSLVPEEERGHYFSKRNRAMGFAGVLAIVTGAIILDGFKKLGSSSGDIVAYTILGFGILFSIAFFARLWGWTMLLRQYEPRLVLRKKDYFSLRQFLKNAPSTSFGRFALFKGFFSIAIGLSSPFWAVYMLRDLGFSYMWFMAVTVSMVIFQLLFLPLIGKFSDKFGNIKLMKVCTTLIMITPLLWFASSFIPNPLAVKLYLLFAPQIVAGFAWAGYNLATNNYIYDAVSQPKQSYGMTYLNLIVGIGTFIGAGLGSLIAWKGVLFMNTLLFIFLASAFIRFIVVVIGLRYLREVRHVPHFSSQFLIREFRPMRGAIREIHNLEHLVEKVEHYID